MTGKISKLKLFLFLMPALLLLGIFFLGPIIWAIYISFTNMALSGPTALEWDFIGFQNYIRLFSEEMFYNSVKLTAFFLLGTIGGQFIFSLLIAVYLKNRGSLVRKSVEISAIVAWVISPVVGGLAWISFVNYPNGLLNILLEPLGFSQPWLITKPLLTATLAHIWHNVAFSVLFFEAALDGVPGEVIDAAKIDGGNPWQIFWFITIPMIKKTILTNLVLLTLFALGAFDIIYIMTGGGPGMKSTILNIFSYRQAFSFYDISFGAAISVIMLLLGVIISSIYIFLIGSKEKQK